jgi:hypothetical protein
MDSLTAVALVGAALFAVWWWFGRGRNGARDAESQLRQICFGNADQVERLIQGEIGRAPGISRAEAASRAVSRYQRDNR